MNKNLYFCSKCNQEEKSDIRTITEQYDIKGESIDVEAKVRFCKKCGEELYDLDLEQETIINAYNIYRENHGLLLPSEIKEIRKKYRLSATSFSKLLGFGEKTITRYENGALQDNAQNNLIVLMDDIYTFKKLWERNKNALSNNENKKINQLLKAMCSQIISLVYSNKPVSDYNFDPSIKRSWEYNQNLINSMAQ
jgi:putative zinc finger/helix-turn-helix YgiT family protein